MALSCVETGKWRSIEEMYPISRFFELERCSNYQSSYLQGLVTAEKINGGGSMMCSSKSTAEEKALAACKSHSEAERRRRKRINGHLATLRTLLPNTIKGDKASLLAEVVGRVRELKKTVSELTAREEDKCSSSYSNSNSMGAWVLPGETDELRVEYSEGAVKASVCCEDRAELVVDLTRALRTVKGKVVRAEMATVGGRTKSVVWVQGLGCGGASGDQEGMETLRRALKVVVDKPAWPSGSSQGLLASKRPRLSLPIFSDHRIH